MIPEHFWAFFNQNIELFLSFEKRLIRAKPRKIIYSELKDDQSKEISDLFRKFDHETKEYALQTYLKELKEQKQELEDKIFEMQCFFVIKK